MGKRQGYILVKKNLKYEWLRYFSKVNYVYNVKDINRGLGILKFAQFYTRKFKVLFRNFKIRIDATPSKYFQPGFSTMKTYVEGLKKDSKIEISWS
jgi:hypothetical protein